MATQQQNKKQSNVASGTLPTEETFWRRYSPHHECLLSVVGSSTVHGLVFGMLFLFALFLGMARTSEHHRPPTMEVVQLADGGLGDEGGSGGEPAPFGTPQKEDVSGQQAKIDAKFPLSQPEKFQEIKGPQLDLPSLPSLDQADGEPAQDVMTALNKIVGEVNRDTPKTEVPKKMAAVVGTPQGKPGFKGSGGFGGPGTGKKGIGPGGGGPPFGARHKTRQEILAWRWRFDMSGDGKEHADKLSAIGVILVVLDPQDRTLVIRDLKRRPVETRWEDLAKFKDAVRWTNAKPDSVFILANELQLPFTPKCVVMFLPKDREEKMDQVEKQFARRLSRPLTTVRYTQFDFQLRNGVYEPIVVRQE